MRGSWISVSVVIFSCALGVLPSARASSLTLTTMEPPGSPLFTFAMGINGAAQIVGLFTDARGKDHGCLRTFGDTFTTNEPSGRGGHPRVRNQQRWADRGEQHRRAWKGPWLRRDPGRQAGVDPFGWAKVLPSGRFGASLYVPGSHVDLSTLGPPSRLTPPGRSLANIPTRGGRHADSGPRPSPNGQELGRDSAMRLVRIRFETP